MPRLAAALLALLAASAFFALQPPTAPPPAEGPNPETATPASRDAGLDAARPAPSARGQAAVSPRRRTHILDGDATGGGHRPGRGLPNKSEFPRGWSDDSIIEAIEDVANDPASSRRTEADGRTVVTGRRHGVDMRVVIERDGRSIVTGYPTNTPRNPR